MFNLVPFRLDELEKSFLPDLFSDDWVTKRWASFKTDITDRGKEYLIEAELPGFSKEEITVELNDNKLTIAAQKDGATEEKNDNYLRKERFSGRVMRTFVVEDVNNEEIKAEFKDGILRLTLPKNEPEQPKSRRIDVN
jgi:HSP20 family protein